MGILDIFENNLLNTIFIVVYIIGNSIFFINYFLDLYPIPWILWLGHQYKDKLIIYTLLLIYSLYFIDLIP